MTLFGSNKQPVRRIDLCYGRCGCAKAANCDTYTAQFMRRMVGRYVGGGSTFRRQLESAVIDLRGFDFDQYMSRVSEIHKGAARRQARKADRQGYACKQFVWNNFLPDIVEINTSMEVRSGGVMRRPYRRTVEQLGGLPRKSVPLRDPACPVHCTYGWGIFEPRPGYHQGDVNTDEKLLAYIKVKRQGSLGIYTSILGHGDYLKFGIMYRLHYAIMEWIGENLDDRLRGLDSLMYGAPESGGSGLSMWKKRCLFQGAYLVLAEQPAAAPAGSS